jgi:hypothetical protein
MAVKTFLEKHFHGVVQYFTKAVFRSAFDTTVVGQPAGALSWSATLNRNWWRLTDLSAGQSWRGQVNVMDFAGTTASNLGSARAMEGHFIIANPNLTISWTDSRPCGVEATIEIQAAASITAPLIGFHYQGKFAGSGATLQKLRGFLAEFNPYANEITTIVDYQAFRSDFDWVKSNVTITNGWHFYGKGNYPSFFGGTVQADKGVISTAVTLEATSTEIAGNTIVAGINSVDVGSVDTNADDFIVLPSLAGVEIGHTIKIACNAGSNFELRTPSTSGEKINTVDSDGTAEYLCTDTDTVIIWKLSATDGWVAQSITALGAVRTAVVPDA